jgi:PelA/Pel-15E family pectate lyase
MSRTTRQAAASVLCTLVAAAWLPARADQVPTRKDGRGRIVLLGQKPAWYATDEAVRIADNVLAHQRSSGGWPKGRDMTRAMIEKQLAALREAKDRRDSTLDNDATHTQIRYLAAVQAACARRARRDASARARAGALKGIEYLLAAQYPNGGWPQFWPEPRGYSRYVTFNDGAMIGAMRVLRDAAAGKGDFAFVDAPRRRRAAAAVEKGIACILNCQIPVDGRRTAWCAQHDDKTLAPRKARSYELPSISGAESVGVVRFLMEIDRPGPEIVRAVQAAVAWFHEAGLTGIRLARKKDPSKPRGYDRIVVKDPAAPPMWARFYEIGTNKPIFCSRDGVPKDSLAEISYERRMGYSWLGYYPAGLLAKHYPAWQKKWAPDRNVLQPAAKRGTP